MKFKVLFIILFLMSTSACSKCTNIKGEYSTHGAGESITYLNILSEYKFTLKHETWQPGNYENKETTNIKGKWSCSNNQLTLITQNSKYESEFIAIGENPLNINASTMIIHFKQKGIHHFLNSEIFYPVSIITN